MLCVVGTNSVTHTHARAAVEAPLAVSCAWCLDIYERTSVLGYFRAKGLEGQCTFETGKPHVMVSINTANLEYQYIL